MFAVIKSVDDDTVLLRTLETAVDGWGGMWPVDRTNETIIGKQLIARTFVPIIKEMRLSVKGFKELWTIHSSCSDHGIFIEDVCCRCVWDDVAKGNHLPKYVHNKQWSRSKSKLPPMH